MATTTTVPGAAVRIDDGAVWRDLEGASRADASEVRDLLAKARELKGLRGRDLAVLANVTDEDAPSQRVFALLLAAHD